MPAAAKLQITALRDQIAEVLERDIVTGAFRPGQRLVERELTSRFGVSSIPVREALQDLEGRGLVVRRVNCGYTVVRLTREEMDSICQLRRLLEPEVLRWAVRRLTGDDADRLRAQHERFAAAAAENNLSAFFHEDLQFHRILWEMSGNRYAARALEAAVGSLFAAGISQARERGVIRLDEEVRKHERLLSQILSGDAEGAAATLLAIADHFQSTLPGA